MLVYSVQLKELRNYDRKISFNCHKVSRKPNQHSKLLFLKINLDTSDWSSTYGKLNFYPITSIFFVIFSLEMRRRLLKTKMYYNLCYSVWKETLHKPLKVATAKKYFLSVHIIDTTCFDDCFLFHIITGRHFVWQIYCSLVKSPCSCFFEINDLTKFRILYLLYPQQHYNVANTIGP